MLHRGGSQVKSLLLGLFRARWGLPLSAGQIKAAQSILADGKVNLVFRTRALEILCFTRDLPYAPKVVVPLVRASLARPNLCLVAGDSGRYLYDLSLCRNGRKILLEQWLDPHSPLAGHWQLPVAAFNGLWPGRPGYRLAIRTALHVFNNHAYNAALRRQALVGLMRAPQQAFRQAMGQLLKPKAQFLDTALTMIMAKKDAAHFVPLIRGIFPKLDREQKVRAIWALEFGFPKGANAATAVPLIRMALRDREQAVVRNALLCIGEYRYLGVSVQDALFYSEILPLVRKSGYGRMSVGVQAMYCFGLATQSRWSLPPAAMYRLGGGVDASTKRGRAWWQQHYAAERASALKWAAEHPNYPSAIPK